eukprot:656819-Hanusia_phi.AAC.1
MPSRAAGRPGTTVLHPIGSDCAPGALVLVTLPVTGPPGTIMTRREPPGADTEWRGPILNDSPARTPGTRKLRRAPGDWQAAPPLTPGPPSLSQ